MDSTSTTAYTLAENVMAPEWTVVVADRQTKGRGRRGKNWESPKGGLWFSLILRPNLPARDLSLVQFYAANSVRRVLQKYLQTDCSVKWPNDLVVADGRKLGGILVEGKTIGDKPVFCVLGIGINLNVKREMLLETATSVLEHRGHKVNPEEVLEAIVSDLINSYETLQDPSKLVSEWWDNCIHKSKLVRFEMPDLSVVSGVCARIDPSGELVIRRKDGASVRVSEGSLRLV